MRVLTILAAAAAASLLAGASAHATIIYQTDFEGPTYSPGPLTGQGGWATFGTAGAASVDAGAPISGRPCGEGRTPCDS